MIPAGDSATGHSHHGSRRIAVSLHVPEAGVAGTLFALELSVQVDFGAEVAVLERGKCIGMAGLESLDLGGVLGEECSFRGDLGEAH